MNQGSSRGSLVAGVILVGLGVLFLIGQLLNIDLWNNMWPLIVIAFGGMFFVGMLAGGRSAGPLAIPGSIITTIGLILWFQNTFGYWETWSYAWTLIVIAVGVGLFIFGVWSRHEGPRRAGGVVMRVGVILFLVFGAFFELAIGISGFRRTGTLFWPVALIALGIYFLLSQAGLFSRRRPPAMPAQPPMEVITTPPAELPGDEGPAPE